MAVAEECGAGDSTYNQKSDGLLRRQDAAWRTHTIKYQLVIAVMEQKEKNNDNKTDNNNENNDNNDDDNDKNDNYFDYL